MNDDSINDHNSLTMKCVSNATCNMLLLKSIVFFKTFVSSGLKWFLVASLQLFNIDTF